MDPMVLRLMWWNPGLRSGMGIPASDRKRFAAYSLIAAMIEKYSFDVIGLCEVSIDDIIELEKGLGDIGFGVVSAQETVNRLQFDMCLICRIEKIRCATLNEPTLIDRESGSAMKVAFMIDGLINDEHILFALSHWPSRIHKHDGHNARGYLGDALRKFVAGKLEQGVGQIALMGDYNDEPYSDVIFQRLRAVRDQEIVSDEDVVLYNPFWRHLAGIRAYSKNAFAIDPSGTHFYSNSNYPNQRWWLFDQMMFSRSFVSSGPWHLNEDKSGVLYIPQDVANWTDEPPSESDDLRMQNKRFDHLPIFATLERES